MEPWNFSGCFLWDAEQRQFPTGNFLGWDGREFRFKNIRLSHLFLGLEIGSSLFYLSFIHVNFESEPQVGSAGREAHG